MWNVQTAHCFSFQLWPLKSQKEWTCCEYGLMFLTVLLDEIIHSTRSLFNDDSWTLKTYAADMSFDCFSLLLFIWRNSGTFCGLDVLGCANSFPLCNTQCLCWCCFNTVGTAVQSTWVVCCKTAGISTNTQCLCWCCLNTGYSCAKRRVICCN